MRLAPFSSITAAPPICSRRSCSAWSGLTLLKYLQPRLLAPLGIGYATWETCPRGINTGGWGLSITTESIARFGQLYLQRGTWHGKQILPEALDRGGHHVPIRQQQQH